jgi:LPXTG-motif cell wall-anchored protein
MFARLRDSFSLISLLAGVMLALAALGLVFTFRKNSKPPESDDTPNPVVQKRL